MALASCSASGYSCPSPGRSMSNVRFTPAAWYFANTRFMSRRLKSRAPVTNT
jgi:hypothetical protein